MVTVGTKLLCNKKIYEVKEMGPWGFKTVCDEDGDIITYSNTTINIDINDGKIKVLEPLVKYTINDLKKRVLNNEIQIGLYTSINEDNQTVIITIDKNYLKISTFQDNGWIRADIYEYDTDDNVWTQSETYEGKWQ